MDVTPIGELHGSPIVNRYEGNPILTSDVVPYHATLVFNSGVTKFQGRYVQVFRNDYGEQGNPHFEGTNLGFATSDDGLSWTVAPKPIWDREQIARDVAKYYGGRVDPDETGKAYDPRLTVLEGRCYMTFWLGTRHGLRGGIAVTDDFDKFEVVSLSGPDNRNMVLFPERVGGQIVRLERPMTFTGGGCDRRPDRFDIWLASSPDWEHWSSPRLVLAADQIPYANDKIGPGAPPVKTDRGWLTLFHGVDRDPSRGKNGWEPFWRKRYSIGIMLLDLEDPSRIIGMSMSPLMVPETPYETSGGFRDYAIFPGGMILEDDGQVRIYYGAADTTECLATAHVDDLVGLCTDLP